MASDVRRISAPLAQDRFTARSRRVLLVLAVTACAVVLAVFEWAAGRLLTNASRAASIAAELTIALIVALVFREIGNRTEDAVREALTRRRREARNALFALSRDVPAYSDPQSLLSDVLDAMDRCIAKNGAAIYVREDTYRAAVSSFALNLQPVAPDDALVNALRSASAPVDPAAYGARIDALSVYPMVARGELVGFFALSASHEHLEADDRQTIMALAQAAGLALAILRPELLAGGSVREKGNLPAEVSTLVAREIERGALTELLARRRIVCVKGPGGIGKSRLALSAANNQTRSFEGGKWIVDLSSAQDGRDVLQSIAGAFGIPQTAAKSQLENVLDFLAPLDVLLIFDNCERAVSALAHVAGEILRRSCCTTIIATSRERLGVPGEAVYEVPPLTLEQSVQLFCERADDVAPAASCSQHLPVIERIVSHLDGIPFAVELAAARMRTHSPLELERRISDIFTALTDGHRTAAPHRQTLRAMLDWSYTLLSSEEQTLFTRLGVFETSFTLDAAVTICSGEGLSEADAAGLIGHLTDKSLVQVEAGAYGQRFRLLEAGRAYAQSLCSAELRATLAERHMAFNAALAHEITSAGASTTSYDTGLERLRLDIDNVYQALERAIDARDLGMAVLFCEDLTHYWFHYVQLRTGREWLSRLLKFESEMIPAQVAAARFAHACMMLFSDPSAALESALRADAAAQQTGDKRLRGQALAAAGNAYLSLGAHRDAEHAYAESAALYDDINPDTATSVRMNLANVIINFDDTKLSEAQALLERALEMAQRTGRRGLEGVVLGNMAQLAHAQGRHEDAYRLSRSSVDTARALGAKQQEAVWLYWLGIYATELGRRDEAAEVLQQALTICREIVADDPEHFSGCIEAVVFFAAAGGQMLDAARMHGFIEAFRKDRSVPRPPVFQTRYDRAVASIRDALGSAQFEALANAGAAESPPRVLEEASELVGCVDDRRAPSSGS